MSGLLHGGVAVVVLWLLVQERGRRRAIGAMVGLGLAAKLWLEQPWGPVLRPAAGWDIALAPLAHATGAAAGLLCGAVALALGVRAGHGASRP